MNISLYQAAAAMKANARWQEVTGENLSASFIPGFKQQNVSFSAVQAGLMAPRATTISGASRHFAMPTTEVSTNFQQGEMKRTGEPTDFSLEGSGFFEVKLPDGSSAYTRDGEFRLNAQGQLVTKQGYQVQSTTGPLQFDRTNQAPISVTADGEVAQGADAKGLLSIVEFKDYRKLNPIGSGYYVVNDPQTRPVPPQGTTVHQGYIESANTSTMKEMVSLITSMRQFEANQKVIQSQDERMGRIIADTASSV